MVTVSLDRRITALEGKPTKAATLRTVYILPDEPTPAELAELARRGLAAFILPDNGRSIHPAPEAKP